MVCCSPRGHRVGHDLVTEQHVLTYLTYSFSCKVSVQAFCPFLTGLFILPSPAQRSPLQIPVSLFDQVSCNFFSFFPPKDQFSCRFLPLPDFDDLNFPGTVLLHPDFQTHEQNCIQQSFLQTVLISLFISRITDSCFFFFFSFLSCTQLPGICLFCWTFKRKNLDFPY